MSRHVTEDGAIHSDRAVGVSSGHSRPKGRRPKQQGAASRTQDSMNDKRQKNQLQMALAFTGEGRSEAPKAPREGPKRSRRRAKPKVRLETNN
jgi:hypothetical protein